MTKPAFRGVTLPTGVSLIASLIRDARGLPSKAWIAWYFIARLPGRPTRLPSGLRDRLIRWGSVPSTLSVGIEAGGLASWYEIAHRNGYAPVPSFRPQRGWIVIDVGANIGAFSAWVAPQIGESGRIIAVEPNPISLRHLRRTLATIATPHELAAVAVGDAPGEMALHYRPGYTVSSSLVERRGRSRSVPVKVSTLDDVLEPLALERIDLVKIDVEGVELAVLKGATRALGMAQRVVVETRLGGEITEAMRSAGFSSVHEQGDNWDKEGLLVLAFEKERE